MDIKELEFIRDFCDDFETLLKDLTDIAITVTEHGTEMGSFDELASHAVFAVAHQGRLLESILSEFKRKSDYKHRAVWKQAYPDSREIEDNG